MPRLIKGVLINLLLIATFTSVGNLRAEVRQLNKDGGTNASNGLQISISDTTQMQVKRLGNGQMYNPGSFPDNTLLDNGVYIRYNNRMYGNTHFAYASPTAFNSDSISSEQPSNISQGVTQSSTSTIVLTSASLSTPRVSIAWKYTYPLDFVTAEVTLTIPLTATVSASNPVRYYHAVDTYLGGSDNGCGVRYTDTNGKLVVGTYPLTNGNCPSSNSLPANLDVVESFRERTDKFDHYCVGFWSDFWSTASNAPGCAISKTGSLADTISTTYQDTGAAIEYDFTSPGIYTFSYDFVVGSTFVPNYDHLEIRHGGSATLCPAEIKVLACLSSAVPCPDNQLVSSGSLQGSLTFSPTTPAVSESPDPFDVGSNQSIATVTVQGTAAGTYTLGATGLTKTPLSGVKCYNTANNSQSCSFTFTNTPCVSTFECMENSLTYNNLQTNGSARNPLYTKVLGQSFDVDVVALLANGAQSSGYNSTLGLTVNLVTDDAGSCGSTIVATKQVAFAAADNGRKKVTFASTDLLRAYPNLRCKVTDLALLKTGCSSDNFAVRPQSLSLASTNATQSSPSASSTPVFKAGVSSADTGTNFNLNTSSGELGYNGTPLIDNTKLVAHSGAPVVGQVNGSFPAATLGSSSGNAFKYSEVGHFKVSAQGVYDNSYTAVDSAKGDCDNVSAPFENNPSVTPKKYGCRFGNTSESSFFGRFIPDHFTVTPNLATTLACNTFVYYGQDTATTPGLLTPFTLIAQNAANATTQNYTGSYAKFDLSGWNNYRFSATPLNGATLLASQMSPAVTGTWSNGTASVSARHRLSRPASEVNPANVVLSAQPQETDSTVLIDSTQTALTGSVPFRYGRLAVTPAHGSELLPLVVPIEAQYRNNGVYVRSQNDSCTAVPLSSIVMRNYRGNLNACETQLSGSATMASGVLNMRLSAPGMGSDGRPNTGSVDLEVNLGAVSGSEMTCLSAAQSAATSGVLTWFGSTDPTARASFGIYKAPIIYMRENF